MEVKFALILFCWGLYSCSTENAESDLGPNKGLNSPIDIITDDIVNIKLPPLSNPFYNPSLENATVECRNDGKSATCVIKEPDSMQPVLTGGPLGHDKYRFDNIHFHWGLGHKNGIEHRLNGRRYASEMHAVFYNTKYNNITNAAAHDDGICALGWFGLRRKKNSQKLKGLFELIKQITDFGATRQGKFKKILGFLSDLTDPTGKPLKNWIAYIGDLPFAEKGIWILFDKPFAISKKGLQRFRNLKKIDGTLNTEHTLEVTLLNNRKVYKPIDGTFQSKPSQLKKNLLH